MHKMAKEWHRSIKKLTSYNCSNQILNLTAGPIAKRKEWNEA